MLAAQATALLDDVERALGLGQSLAAADGGNDARAEREGGQSLHCRNLTC